MVRSMSNPNYPILEILVRLGIALGLGLLVFIVPIAIRNARFAPTTLRRILHILAAILAAAGFVFGVRYMLDHFVPKSPDAPQKAPVEYPSLPQN
jgi:protein-S-isoprenylcysteine O-methyltransferase Ste14